NKDDVLGDGTVKFDPENVKLTLNNADIEISRREDSDDGKEYGIRSNLGDGMAEFRDKPLTIELIGANTISDSNNDEGTTNKYGIFVASSGPVTYTGGGTLNVNMKDANTAQRYLGLEHRQSITVDGVDINIDIDGTSNGINGIYMLYTNTLKLTNGANVTIDVAKGYAFDNDVHTNNNDLDVTEGCTFEAVSGGENGALHGSGWIQLTDATKALGVMVNEASTASGRKLWDGETNLREYQYVRIPEIKSVTVNYDLGEGHEALAQAEALRDAINGRYAMQVLEVNGSVVTIRVPELSDSNTKNTVARLLGALRAALNESVGHDPTYGPYWVYDQNEWNFNNALKTIDNYNSYEEVRAEREQLETDGTMPEEGQTIYALWAKPISEVAVNVESPICGTEVTADLEDPEDPEMGYDPLTQKPQPVVSISTDRVSVNKDEDGWENTWWVDSTKKDEDWFTILPPCYTGTMVGDEDYMLVVSAEPDFGYYIARDATYTTSNGTVDAKLSHSLDMFADIYITVTAKHELEKVDEIAATCTEDGAKEHWKCTHCDKLFADAEGAVEIAEAEAIPATGHDWGEPSYEWADDNSSVTATRVCKNDANHVETETVDTTSAVTKEPTETEEGERTYTATFTNDAFATQTKTEAISKLDPQPDAISYSNTAGDGSTWTKGSKNTLDFTFKRNVDDSKTYDAFEGLQVDGKDVPNSNYTSQAGSVIVKLKPAYLETLSVGTHTIKAIFSDGNNPEAQFEIVEKKTVPTNKTTPKQSSAAGKTSTARTADSNPVVPLLGLAFLSLVGVFGSRALRRRMGE
ncbi:MAG: hypothetical protein IJ113_07125, partial [Eggerthellaceae bacterium]|nr:hypothetical protein [Eggerthellaceae bacterium]